MKQLIVLIATIILGLAIGSFIMGFSDDAEILANSASKSVNQLADKLGK